MITEEELRSNLDWDFIKLNFDIDLEKLHSWYYEVIQQFPNLKFNSSMTHLITNIDVVTEGVNCWGMSWPVEQDLPIPPKYAARPDLYPETTVTDEEFGPKMKIMERYKFGYFNELLNKLGEDTFSYARIAAHEPGAVIHPHTDGAHTIRLHIPIITNDEALFCWGDKKYNFKPGCVYLINTAPEHSTINNGDTTRAHIISYPTNINWLLTHREYHD